MTQSARGRPIQPLNHVRMTFFWRRSLSRILAARPSAGACCPMVGAVGGMVVFYYRCVCDFFLLAHLWKKIHAISRSRYQLHPTQAPLCVWAAACAITGCFHSATKPFVLDCRGPVLRVGADCPRRASFFNVPK